MLKKLAWCTLAVATLLCSVAHAQAPFPNRPIKIVVPNPPGGANDLVARALADALQRDLGQPIIIENKAGASGAIGADYVAKAAPDGYTLFVGTGSTHVVAPAMMKSIPYDPVKDFTPLALVGRAIFVLYAGPSLSVKTLPELVAYARSRPGQVSFGTSGPAAAYELAAMTLESVGELKFNHVPYKGLAQIVQDLAGGHVDVAVGPAGGPTENPKVRPLAALGAKRVSSRPDVPSAAEQGYPGFDVPAWAGVFTAPHTPAPVVARLTSALLEALKQPEVRQRIAATGIDVDGAPGPQLERIIRQELGDVQKTMLKLGVQPE